MDELTELRLRRERAQGEVNRYLATPVDADDERLSLLLETALLKRDIIDIKIAFINTTNEEERRELEQDRRTKEQLILLLLPPQQMVVTQPAQLKRIQALDKEVIDRIKTPAPIPSSTTHTESGLPLPSTSYFDQPSQMTIWFVLRSINGSLCSLSEEPGFRNYVARNLRDIGVSGYIQRIPRTDADLIVKGTREQLSRVRDFLNKIKQQGIIERCYVRNGTPMYEPEDEFEVMASDRPKVVTGNYSNREWDIVSVSTRSETPILKSPSPHNSDF